MKLVTFGDSVTQGGPSPIYWPELVCVRKGWQLLNLGISGACAADAMLAIYGAPQGDRTAIALGLNDQRLSTNAELFGQTLGALAYYRAQQTTNALTWEVTGGNWSANAPYTVGRVASAVGAQLTVPFCGTVLTFGYCIDGRMGASGGFTVSIDGAAAQQFSSVASSTMPGLAGYGPALGRMSGLIKSSTHTAVFTQNQPGYVWLDWLGGKPSASALRLCSIQRMAANGYASFGGSDANVAAFNAIIESLVAQMQADGLDVKLADTGSAIDPSTDLMADGVHPTYQGQVNLASGFGGC